MKTYRVYALHKEYVYADVIAESEEEAYEKIDFENHDCIVPIDEVWDMYDCKEQEDKK